MLSTFPVSFSVEGINLEVKKYSVDDALAEVTNRSRHDDGKVDAVKFGMSLHIKEPYPGLFAMALSAFYFPRPSC